MTKCNSYTTYSTIETIAKTSQSKASVITDAEVKLLIESATFLNWLAEYCGDLYLINQTSVYIRSQTSSRQQKNAHTKGREVGGNNLGVGQ
ncbi:hypothetical protein DPMN_145189 [Dreissena polymorpha]|uniref:Uncharacterized protein n=1 Tax=Dreissena polymorpha TaxID=45954 RepID=A0A9D4F854_DREPO|nr:hypothetical protein DPMN_145189 [Dreissena polymorpha]